MHITVAGGLWPGHVGPAVTASPRHRIRRWEKHIAPGGSPHGPSICRHSVSCHSHSLPPPSPAVIAPTTYCLGGWRGVPDTKADCEPTLALRGHYFSCLCQEPHEWPRAHPTSLILRLPSTESLSLRWPWIRPEHHTTPHRSREYSMTGAMDHGMHFKGGIKREGGGIKSCLFVCFWKIYT